MNVSYFNKLNSFIYSEYKFLLLFFCFSIFLSCLLILLSYYFSFQLPDTEKLSAYECGFEPYEDARHTFDVKFYIVALLFIIFDIETMYLLPWCVSLSKLDLLGFWSMIDFILELGIGFFYICYLGALEWD